MGGNRGLLPRAYVPAHHLYVVFLRNAVKLAATPFEAHTKLKKYVNAQQGNLEEKTFFFLTIFGQAV